MILVPIRTTYSNPGWIKNSTSARNQVTRALEVFFGVDWTSQHDNAFGEEYRKIDYDKIREVRHFATYQEDMIGVVPQLKSVGFIFIDKDKRAHFKVCGNLVYGMDNELGHMNVECCYCTYGSELDNVFTEYYQGKPEYAVLAEMKHISKRIYAAGRGEEQSARLVSRIMEASINGLYDSRTPEERIFGVFD